MTVLCVFSGYSTRGCNTPKHTCTCTETCHHSLLGRAVVFISVSPLPSCLLSAVSPFWQLVWEGSSVLSAAPASTTHLLLIHLIAFRSTAPAFKPGLISRPLPVRQSLWGHHPFHSRIRKSHVDICSFWCFLAGCIENMMSSWNLDLYSHRLTVYPFIPFFKIKFKIKRGRGQRLLNSGAKVVIDELICHFWRGHSSQTRAKSRLDLISWICACRAFTARQACSHHLERCFWILYKCHMLHN